MKFIRIALFFASVTVAVESRYVGRQDDSLILVHVLFRHGNRTPNGPEELYPNDPYLKETYLPTTGLGQLTNAGKRREYSIGKALRHKYDTFLGAYYYPDLVDARSTNVNRTKASLGLVLASLFAPSDKQIWRDNFNWQPVPYNYWPVSEDKVLQGTICPYYTQLYARHTQSLQQQSDFSKYKKIFEYIGRNSGRTIASFQDVYNLNFGLTAEAEWGFKLPQWTKRVWPEPMADLAAREYFVQTATTELKQMASGYLLKKIISDTEAKINGQTNGRKIYLYSAHENNLANLLITLDVFNAPHIPTYGSYITFEIHRINGVYGVKIYYENYTKSSPELMKIPSCDTFCPLNRFIALMKKYLPRDDLCNYEEIVYENYDNDNNYV